MVVGDLVMETSEHYGLTFGIVQEIIEDQKGTILTLGTVTNPNMIWNTYKGRIKYNYGKISVEEAKEKYPERLI